MYKNSLKAKLCIKKMRDDTMEDIDRMYVCVCVSGIFLLLLMMIIIESLFRKKKVNKEKNCIDVLLLF